MSDSKQADAAEEAVQVSLTWDTDSRIPTIFANQFLISRMGPQFYLVFGEVEPPLVPDLKVALGSSLKLPVRPVAKIAVTPETMLAIAKAINTNLDRSKNQP